MCFSTRGSKRDRSNCYAGYTLEAFTFKKSLSERVFEDVVRTKTVDERKSQFKFNALRRESPIASWGSA